MPNLTLYPEISALPVLAAPVARCKSFSYGSTETNRRFLVVPARILSAAGLAHKKAVYVATVGGITLVSSNSRKGQRRVLTGSSDRGSVLQLTVTRLPEGIRESSVLLAGPGYVLIVDDVEALRYAALPEFEKHDGLLNEEVVPEVDLPLPNRQALLWRELTTACYGRSQRCLDVTGNVWSVAGFELDSPLRVTRYNDGVLVERVTAEEANSQLRSKLARGKRAYGGKRFGRAILSTIQGDTIRVIVMDGALALVGVARSLADFDLRDDDRRSYDTPATAADAQRNAPGNTTVVPLDRAHQQVTVHGAWLTNYGFKPGQRYSIEQHPVIRNRMLAVLDDSGKFEVPEDGNAGANLELPMLAISHFRSPALKVIGTKEGLHLQQHFTN